MDKKDIKELYKSWENCLKMWKWVAENYERGMKIEDIHVLKRRWINKNHTGKKPKFDCFFCEYADNKFGMLINHPKKFNERYCPKCPGYLVSKGFSCEDYKSYSWHIKPKQFYKKLLKLHKKYQESKTN